MKENANVEEIKYLIKNFKLPQQDTYTECMLVAQTKDSFYYKGGIFICSKDSTNMYAGLTEFWVRTFYSFIENAWIGNLFHDILPLVHWDDMSSKNFTEEYLELFKKYSPDHMFLEMQAYKESYIEIENRIFHDAISVLNGPVVSSVAKANGDYISYFIVDDDIGMRHKWPKAKR